MHLHVDAMLVYVSIALRTVTVDSPLGPIIFF